MCGILICIYFVLAFISCENDKYKSPGMMVVNRNTGEIYVALTTYKAVSIIDIGDKAIVGRISLPLNPTGLALSSNGQLLYVSAGKEDGHIYTINTVERQIVADLLVGHSPERIVLSKDEKSLFVANRFSNNISVIDLAQNKIVRNIPVVREPRSIQLSVDGKMLFVANFLPDQQSKDSIVASKITFIDTETGDICGNVLMPNGSQSVFGLSCSLDGSFLYVTHLLSRYNMPLTQLDRGWINTNALSIIDIKNKNVYATLLLDDIDNGAANPADIYQDSDGKLYIAVSGTNELMILDMNGLCRKLDSFFNSQSISQTEAKETLSSSLNFLTEFKKRIQLEGKSPRYIEEFGNQIIISSYFSSFLEIYDPINKAIDKIRIGKDEINDANRRGEQLFCDATLCYQKWQSCVSCHPDARMDGINWDQMNDGLGNPKNTKSLLFSHKTPPSMVTGIRASAEIAVRKGILHILNSPVSEESAICMDSYLQSLTPVASPYIQSYEAYSRKIGKSGEELFEKANCISCHNGDYYTDGKSYNVGTGVGNDKERAFDTPTLREVWRTGPYLYDGRARTIKEVLTIFNFNEKHGMTHDLTEEEIKLLELYVLTL